MNEKASNSVASDLETVGLELSGMREVIQLLQNEGYKEIRGDVFGFLESSLQRYVDMILNRAGDLRNISETFTHD